MESKGRNRAIRKRIATVSYIAGVVSTLTITVILLAVMKVVFDTKNNTDASNSAVNTDKTTQSSSAVTPQVQVSEYPKAEGLLVLVNWDNPTSDERPESLVPITMVIGDEAIIQNADSSINQEAGINLAKMLKAAASDGIDRYVITSAYRSVEYQRTLWENRLKTDPDYGKNPYESPVKVMPGNMSEHATGLAVDILNTAHTSANDAYGESESGKWLAQNAHKYGFIIRYPKDKEHITGVIYEPWHVRYVGKEAAEEIYNMGVCLEEYLGEA